jgi:hypothetical protein
MEEHQRCEECDKHRDPVRCHGRVDYYHPCHNFLIKQDTPIVLHLKGCDDSSRAASLIKKRWPHARLIETDPCDHGNRRRDGGVWQAQEPHEGDIWLLGLRAHTDQPPGIWVVDSDTASVEAKVREILG